MSYFFPPEVMGAHIGNRHCHATFRQHSIAFRGLTALFGHMGLELDPVSADEEERAGYRKYAALHKQWRDVIHHGVQWRIDMPDATTLAHGVVSPDKAQAIFLVSQLAMPDYTLMAPLLPGGPGGERPLSGDAPRSSEHSDHRRGRPHHAEAAGMDDDAADGER